MKFMELAKLPDVLTIPEIATYMRISKPHAYELAKHADFPTIKIGRSVRVSKEAFLRWLDSRK